MFNVIDKFRQWSVDEIKNDLDERRHNFSVCITNKFHDMNIGTIIRNCNAFLGKEVFIYGKRQYDRRGAVGTQNYEHISFVKEVEEIAWDQYVVVGIDNIEGAENISKFKFDPDKHYLFCFGQETEGLCQEILEKCQYILYIQQFGSVRSINVGCAASVVMYEFTSQMH